MQENCQKYKKKLMFLFIFW